MYETHRQQDKQYSIYPATVRDLIYHRFTWQINSELKELATNLVLKDDAISRVCDWLNAEFVRISPRSYNRDNNREIYQQVIKEQVQEAANKIYGKDEFDRLFGVVKVELEEVM